MKKFLFGVIVGFALASSLAYAAIIMGSDGYLMGWSIMVDGEEICSDPFIWTSIQEIECG